MLLGNDVLYVEADERRRILRHMTVLTPVACTAPDEVTSVGVHARKRVSQENGELSTG